MKGTTAISKADAITFVGFGVLAILSILLGFYFDQKALIVLPLVLPIIVLGIINFKALYYFLLFCIPLSIEFDVSNSLRTDLPTEPLMIGLMLVVVIHLIKHAKSIDLSFFRNSIMVMLLVHLFWIFTTTTTSLVPFFSIKFLLAKLWYTVAFGLATAIVIRQEKDLRNAFWSVHIPLMFTVLIALIRHAFINFSFDDVNAVLTPFYRNHVNYAALLVVFIPFVVYARYWYDKGSFKRNVLNVSVLILVIATYFSYTRACYLALIATVAAYFIFRWKLTKMAIFATVLGVVGVVSFVVHDNHYLRYAPSTNTVSQHEFGDLVDATFKAEDVSSMERIYRWIAAIHMTNDRPITGFGPNGFVSYYKNYTVFIFETWISDNEEQSGVHNYFLMTLVEQGIPGLFVFVGLLIAIFLYGTYWYHRSTEPYKKRWIMAIMLSTVALTVNLVFSDQIEVDKTGSFFFINMFLLVLIVRDYKGIISVNLNSSAKNNIVK